MNKAATKYILHMDGREECIPCMPEKTILHSLIEGGIFLEANCGGRGTCGKCKIQVLQGEVKGKDGVAVQPERGNTYQACQIYPASDLTILLKSSEASQKGQSAEIIINDEIPLVRKAVLTPAYPTVDNHYSLQEMIYQAVAEGRQTMSSLSSLDNAVILRQLNNVVETKPECITITILDNKVIAVEAGNTTDRLYGVAFDIGTTTVVGMLVDINAKRIIGVCSKNNPQASMGADVISRIQATHELEGGLERLSQLIRQCLNQLIVELCDMSGVEKTHIYAGTIAGNATMAHLVAEIPPSTLVRKPYAALFKYMAPIDSLELDLDMHPQGKMIILPNIASFVGSDTTAAVLAVDQDVAGTPLLLVDLGTNGEMVIGSGNSLYACSTAAGPAFEGAHIRDGMRAAEGAICDVVISEQDVRLQVIGNSKPAGICGSGLVKAVAELLNAGILHKSGRFNNPDGANISGSLRERLQQRDGQWEFVLSSGAQSASGNDIAITQADVRQLQLVKSSICTGIQFLLEKYHGCEPVQVCLAGAFGNYIDVDSAITIGMLPGIKREQVVSVGNAAGNGAVQALISAEKMQRCMQIAANVAYLELAVQPEFQNRFLKNLNFLQ